MTIKVAVLVSCGKPVSQTRALYTSSSISSKSNLPATLTTPLPASIVRGELVFVSSVPAGGSHRKEYPPMLESASVASRLVTTDPTGSSSGTERRISGESGLQGGGNMGGKSLTSRRVTTKAPCPCWGASAETSLTTIPKVSSVTRSRLTSPATKTSPVSSLILNMPCLEKVRLESL